MARPGSRRVDVVVEPPDPGRKFGTVRDVRTREIVDVHRRGHLPWQPVIVELRGRDGVLIECLESDLLDALKRCGAIRTAQPHQGTERDDT